MKSILLVLFFLCSFSACTKTDVVAEVGSYRISQRDIEQRNQIIRIYYPDEQRALGLRQLVNAYTSAQILVNNGHAIDDKVLRAEAERIQTTSLMPEMLEKIKNVFGADTQSYLRVYVLPTYAERVIYFDFFLKNPKFHAASFAAAESFAQTAGKDPARFEMLAKNAGKVASDFTVSPAGLEWKMKLPEERDLAGRAPAAQAPARVSEAMKNQREVNNSSEAKRWIEDVIQPLKPGGVSPKVIDLGEMWEVVRYVRPAKTKGVYEMQGIAFPKNDYAKWLEAEREKVKPFRVPATL